MADATGEITTALLLLLRDSDAIKALTGADADGKAKAHGGRVPEGVKPPWVRFYGIGESSEGVFQSSSPVSNRNRLTMDGAAAAAVDAKALIVAVMAVCDGTSLTMLNFEGGLQRTCPSREFWDETAKHWVMSTDYLIITSPK